MFHSIRWHLNSKETALSTCSCSIRTKRKLVNFSSSYLKLDVYCEFIAESLKGNMEEEILKSGRVKLGVYGFNNNIWCVPAIINACEMIVIIYYSHYNIYIQIRILNYYFAFYRCCICNTYSYNNAVTSEYSKSYAVIQLEKRKHLTQEIRSLLVLRASSQYNCIEAIFNFVWWLATILSSYVFLYLY